MSCRCESMKLAREIERARRLAKALAKIENDIVGIYLKEGGVYDFNLVSELERENEHTILEYITPY